MDKRIKIIIERLDALEERVAAIENQTTISSAKIKIPHVSKKPSLREFLLLKKPSDDVKKTLVIGFYLEKSEGLKSFSISDLENAFERAKEKKPVNINDKVNMNIRNGHMEETSEKKGNRKAWYLTNSGEQFVENNFNPQK